MIKESVEQATVKATYALAAGSTIAGFTVNEFIALCGLGLGVLTFILNAWYKRELLKIARTKGLPQE